MKSFFPFLLLHGLCTKPDLLMEPREEGMVVNARLGKESKPRSLHPSTSEASVCISKETIPQCLLNATKTGTCLRTTGGQALLLNCEASRALFRKWML